jgi:hypothetical protein
MHQLCIGFALIRRADYDGVFAINRRQRRMANTKPVRPNKFVTFGPLTYELLDKAHELTGLTISQIVNALLQVHIQELTEFCEWLGSKPEGDEARVRGIHAIQQYGPDDLITTIKQIDPTYQVPAAVQMVAGASILTPDEITQIRAMLVERSHPSSRERIEE